MPALMLHLTAGSTVGHPNGPATQAVYTLAQCGSACTNGLWHTSSVQSHTAGCWCHQVLRCRPRGTCVIVVVVLLCQVGFNVNLWSGLQLLHLLFHKEHNAVCDMLKQKHPDWWV